MDMTPLSNAVQHFNNKSYHEALQQFTNLINNQEIDQGLVYNCIGICYCHLSNYHEAIKYSNKALEEGFHELEVYQNLSNAYFNLHDSHLALEYALKAKDIAPHNPYIHLLLGNALYLDTQLDDAIQEYEGGIELNPKIAELHYRLGKALIDVDRYDYAVNAFLEAINKGMDNGKVNYNLAKCFELNNSSDKAKKYYYIATEDDYPLAYKQLGIILLGEGKHSEAIEFLEKYLHSINENHDEDKLTIESVLAQLKTQKA